MSKLTDKELYYLNRMGLEGFTRTPRVYVEKNENTPIHSHLYSPHYTDRDFKEPQTVFLRPGYKTVKHFEHFGVDSVDGCSYDYDDRIRGWYTHEEREAAWEAAKEKHQLRTAAFIQEYLRILYKEPTLTIIHIVAGVNHSNGYPYNVFGYTMGGKNEQTNT